MRLPLNNKLLIWQKTLVATEHAATAAQKNADVTERALFTAERLHLILQDLRMDGFIKRIEEEERSLAAIPEIQRLTMPRTLRLTYKIKNYGKSPAFLTLAVIYFKMVNQLPIPFGYGQSPIPRRGWILPPDDERIGERFLESGQLSESDRMLIVEGEKHLVVFGMLEYTDIFRNTHIFGFACHYIVGGGADPGNRFEPTGSEEFWRYS